MVIWLGLPTAGYVAGMTDQLASGIDDLDGARAQIIAHARAERTREIIGFVQDFDHLTAVRIDSEMAARHPEEVEQPHRMMIVDGDIEVCDTCVNSEGNPVAWDQAHTVGVPAGALTFEQQIEAVDRADWRSQYRTRPYPGVTGGIPDRQWLTGLHAEGYEIVKRAPSDA